MSLVGKENAGVYVIECPAGLYVGESQEIDIRQSIIWARTFGLTVRVIRLMPGSSKKDRLRVESEVVKDLRSKGQKVLSLTIEEVVRRARSCSFQTHEELSQAGRKGAEGQKNRVTKRQRQNWGRKGGLELAKLPLTEKQLQARRENGRRVGLTGIGRRVQLESYNRRSD